LQHSHIVPLYSAHDFPERGLHGLCMPYFGGFTLAELLSKFEPKFEREVTGQDLLAELGRANSTVVDESMRSPTRSFLQHASAAEVVCWIGACLADALQYAHDRGLLHLDVKPSNILIAADGTPMLLDFHLARPPLQEDEPAPARLGGTSGFMPPEQVEAMQAVASAGFIRQPVDARADVFALGVLLDHCLRKFTGKELATSIALADILRRCTATLAADRYPTAGALANDLRRHLSDLPLQGVANRSLPERWNKWRRRRPYALPLAMTLAALVLVLVGLIIRAGQLVRGAGESLGNGERNLAERRYREAGESFRAGEAFISGVPGQRELRERLRQGRIAAERGQMAADLHALCERVRPLYGAESNESNAVAEQCRALWDRRDAIRRQLADRDPAEESWRSDLLDLGILTAHLEVRTAAPAVREAACKNALATLDEAEQLFGPSGVLELERTRFARELGNTALAEESTRRFERMTPRTAWEHQVVGRALLIAGKLDDAARHLDLGLALDPRSLWAHYYKGESCLRRGQTVEAIAEFSACIALAPESPWCFHNRGLAYLKGDRLESALVDFNRALTIDPDFGNAYLSRAAVLQKLGREQDAQADLRKAEELGAR
jgi:tetratricopeptide (TPR) repeat protein